MAYIYDLTDTWNAGGTAFNAIKMNVTDSASAAGSKLVTLQTNGTEHFSVTKAGVGYFSGNVGIGTSSPGGYKLAVTSASNLLVLSDGSTQNMFVTVTSGAGSAGAFNFNANNGGQFIWQNAGAEKMRIDGSGNVGIGTSSPSAKLEVYGGSIKFGNASGNALLTADGVATYIGSLSNHPLVLNTNNTERARIDASGNLLVGKTSGNHKIETVGAAVDGNAAVSVSTATTIYAVKQSTTATMCVIYGDNGSSGFMDMVFFLAGKAPVTVSSQAIYGTPPTRTYTASTTNLQLAMGSGTYNVRTAAFTPLNA